MNSELQWIERLRRRVGLPRGTGVVLGIGDDCAIFRPRGSVEDLLFTTDLLLEDVHFRRATHRADDVGWKAVARGLSDIAAMGGDPRFFLVSLAVPQWADARWLSGFYRGALDLAARERVLLAGGDVARSERLACDIVVCGSVPRAAALRRAGARAGNAIYVSGRLGGSALGLARGRGAAWRRHARPEPRLALGRFLRERLHATAAMDLSDGLSLDLRRLCLAARSSATLDAPPPRFPGATLEQALHGGEDYELLFTVASSTRVPPAYQGIPLTRIGVVTRGRPGMVRFEGRRLEPLGYDHFGG